LYITSLVDPQEAIACLQLKFNQVKAELAETKEELIKAQEELKNRESSKCMYFTLIWVFMNT
jgi:kinesin family protein 20